MNQNTFDLSLRNVSSYAGALVPIGSANATLTGRVTRVSAKRVFIWQLIAVVFSTGALVAMPCSALAAKHAVWAGAVAAEEPSGSAVATSSDSTAEANTDVSVEVKSEPEAARKDV